MLSHYLRHAGAIPWGMFKELNLEHSLEALYLGGNKFTVNTIPGAVSEMVHLKELGLDGLGFTGKRSKSDDQSSQNESIDLLFPSCRSHTIF